MSAMFEGEITAGYGSEPVLSALAIDIPMGTSRLTGTNGVGKSLLLSTLAGVVPPSGGHVRSIGKSINDKSVRRTIGYVPPEPPLYPELSITEHIRILKSLNRALDAAALADRICHYALDNWADHPVGDLSTGNRQKANILLNTLLPHKVLLLDEPFRGLDSRASAALCAEIASWKSAGIGMLLVQHEQVNGLAFDFTFHLTRHSLTRHGSFESPHAGSSRIDAPR